MNDLTVNLHQSKCSPGQILTGKVTWSSVSEGSEAISIRLIWFTSGKGDRDYQIVDSVDVMLSGASEDVSFEFQLPRRPLGFEGKLISLIWAVEAVVKPSNQSALVEFELTDGYEPIALTDKSDQLKAHGMSKPFFSMGQNG